MRGVLVAVTIALAAISASGHEDLPLKTVAAIKEATVMITTTAGPDGRSGGTGSGFLIRGIRDPQATPGSVEVNRRTHRALPVKSVKFCDKLDAR